MMFLLLSFPFCFSLRIYLRRLMYFLKQNKEEVYAYLVVCALR